MTEKSCRYLLVLILLCVFCIVPAIAEASNDYWAPWVTNTTTNSATINWRGESNGLGSIDYATSSYFNQHHSFENTTSAQVTAQYQHVQLTGLEPNTSYTYWVRPSGNESAFGNRTFRTMPLSGPFTFIVVGDTREGINYTEAKRFKYVADAIGNESNVLFVLHGGDFARFDLTKKWAAFFECADRMLAKSTFFPVIGNHEYHNHSNANLDEEHYHICPGQCRPCNDNCSPPTAAVNYHSAFGMPLNYSFDCAGIRFVVLNSPDVNYSCCDDPQTSTALAESQASWLQQQLDNNMSGTFTIHHHPIWDAGRTTINSNLSSWENLYHTYDISANFAGHTHNYQRYNISGIPYFIVGNGGAPNDDVNNSTKYPIGLQSVLPMQLGYLKVTVDPANNTATAWEITVGKLTGWEDNETPQLYNPPVVNDTITFPLKAAPFNPTPTPSYNASKAINKEQIKIGNKHAEAYESGSAMNNINIVTSQGPSHTSTYSA
jgi:predicted phosphodiesterase